MMERFVSFLLGLSPRERRLLGALFWVAIPLALAFGVVVPLINKHQSTAQDLVNTRALSAWVNDRAADHAALIPAAQTTQIAPTIIGISAIEQSLRSADLRDAVARLSNRDDGEIDLGFDAVDFQTLTQWLSAVQPDWGYRLGAFSIERTDRAGLVRADFVLEPAL